MKKMSETKVSRRGRKAVLTDSGRKRRRTELNARNNKNRIYIGSEYNRWNELKCTLKFQTHAEVARILLDSYEKPNAQAAIFAPSGFENAVTSTPGQIKIFTHMSDISEISSSGNEMGKIEETQMSGVDEISEKTVFKKESSFINPFDLTITKSEGTYETVDDSDDEDYEPLLSLSLSRDDQSCKEMGYDSFDEDTDDEYDCSDQPEAEPDPGLKSVETENDVEEFLNDKPLLVFLGQLTTLAKTKVPSICKIKECGREIEIKTAMISSALYFKWVCENGHLAHRWCSQPIFKRRLHCGDLLFASALLLSGSNYHKMAMFSKFMNLPVLSSSTYLRIQRTYLIPSIDRFWISEQNTVLEEFKDQDVILLGDGRMDSPGHSAQYCTYTFMEMVSKKVLCIITMDKRMTDKKSTNLEKACFLKGLRFLLEKNVRVVEIVTDAHVQIEALMKKDFPAIKHSFDIWHGAKNLGKKIIQAGQEKNKKPLLEWTKDVVNHYWHCAAVSKTVEEFVGLWLGIVHHVVNEHEWILAYSDSSSSSCLHGPLTTARDKGWLQKGSPAHDTLREIVMNKRLLKKIPYYLNCRSTADLENFQNLILKYATKRHSYKPPAFRARNILAALDNNANCDRSVLLNKDGSTRFQRYYSKKGGRWSAYSLKTEKTYHYIADIFKEIFKMRIFDDAGMNQNVVLDINDPRRMSATLAPVPPPPTAVIVAEQKSRFTVGDPDKTIDYFQH